LGLGYGGGVQVPVNSMFAPKWLLYLVGPLMGMPRDVVRWVLP
jgi:hypothetical protein